jgi:hypothetical protein
MAVRSYPRGVPIRINYPEIPLYAFLENSARKFPKREAVVFYGRRITYEELWDSSQRRASPPPSEASAWRGATGSASSSPTSPNS